MDDIKRVRHPHTVRMEDRKKAQFTGITDVVSFEPSKVILESDYGVIVIKGESLMLMAGLTHLCIHRTA